MCHGVQKFFLQVVLLSSATVHLCTALFQVCLRLVGFWTVFARLGMSKRGCCGSSLLPIPWMTC